jgi:hypothetical protein
MLFVLLALVLLCAAVAGFALYRAVALQQEVDRLRADWEGCAACYDELEAEVLPRLDALEAEHARLQGCVETLERPPIEEDYDEGEDEAPGNGDLQSLLANVATALTTLRPPPPRVEEVEDEETDA